jgi:hypothetical protein
MDSLRRIIVVGMLATGTVATAACAEGMDRFWALFFDGSQVSAAKFGNQGWWSDEALLAGRRLFGTQNPVRMLEDRTQRGALLGPHVVLANGDVLPGRIVEFLPAESEGDLPARLLISLTPPLIAADPHGVAVRAERVLRSRSSANATPAEEPGALVLADGAKLIATAIRWTDQGVKALTEKGIVAASFAAIGDLCVPNTDTMRAVLDDGFYPPLEPDAVMGRLETVQGAALTYHREMTLLATSKAASARGGGSPPEPYLLVWPSWSLGVILVPIDSIWRQSFRSACEVPLSELPATVLREKIGIHRWPWRRNQNVESGTLSSGRIAVDLGVGMHSYCEVAFELPPQASRFTTLVGLDRCVGEGACATCKIYQDQLTGKPLFASPFLRGSQQPIPVGPLPVAGIKRLVLVAEWAGEARPPGAYPLDIGSNVNWLMPFVTVEEDSASRWESLQRFVPGWRKWNLDPADVARVHIRPHWDERGECWLPAVSATGQKPLTISRKLSAISLANDLVELIFAHPKDAPVPVIELRVDGVRLEPATQEHDEHSGIEPGPLPRRPAKAATVAGPRGAGQTAGAGISAETPQPYRVQTMRWNLQAFHERAVQLTLRVSLHQQSRGLVWRQFALKSTHPESKFHPQDSEVHHDKVFHQPCRREVLYP